MARNIFVIKEFDEFGGVTIYPMAFTSVQAALDGAEEIAYDKFRNQLMKQVYVIRDEEQVIVERIDCKPYQTIRRFDIDDWILIE